MAKVKKFLNIVVSAVLVCALLLGSAYTGVFAVDQRQTYTIKDLYDRGQAKLVGRTEFVNGNLLTEWASSGFELSVTAPAGGADLTLNTYYEIFSYHYAEERFGEFSPVKVYEDIIIDDEDINPELKKQGNAYGYDFRMKAYPTELDSKGDKDLFDKETTTLKTTLQTNFSVTRHIPEGTHTVRIIRDSGPDKYHNYTHQYVSVTTSATINDKPADKPLYIDCIGDSYGTGSGTLNPYYTKAGIGGGSEAASSSIVNSYAYVVARQLGADLSIESMGGYGVLGNTGASVEDVSSGTSMLDIYPYADAENAFRKEGTVAKYVQNRRPDLVIIALGSNDGQVYMDGAVDSSGKHKSWKAEADRLIKMARTYTKDGKPIENDTTIPLVWMTTGDVGTYKQYMFMLKAKEVNTTYTDEEDSSHDIEKIENLHPLRLFVGGNGGVALGSQEHGHPSCYQEQQMGRYLKNFILAEKILPEQSKVADPKKSHTFEYYVDGISNGTGTEQSPFKYIADAENKLAGEINKFSGSDETIDAKIYVMNNHETVPSSASVNGSSLTGCTTEVKTSDGNPITVQIIGYDSKGDGSKAWMLAADGGVADGWAWRKLCNNYRFSNIILTGRADGGTQSGFACIYTFGHDVTFDYGFEIYKSTPAERKVTTEKFTQLNGSNSTSGTSATATTSNTPAGKITINSGSFGTVNVAGIGGNGAYGPQATSTDGWVYDVYTAHQNFAVEVNGGEIDTLQGGSNSMISGKNTEISYEINGGHIKNMRAGAQTTSNICCMTQYADFNVTVNGGQIDNYIGLTGGATSENPYIYIGNYNFTMNGGTIGKSGTKVFKATESYVTVKNITNNINEGHIYVEPAATTSTTDYNYNGVFLGGYSNVTVKEKLTNNISGGEIMSRYIKETPARLSFGGLWDLTTPEILNNISGGRFIFYPKDEEDDSPTNAATVCFAGFRSKVDKVTNNVSGGLFDAITTNSNSLFYFGCQELNSSTYTSWIGTLVNNLGSEGYDVCPTFLGGMSYLGGMGQSIGTALKDSSGNILKTAPEVNLQNMSDTPVITNNIYGIWSTGSVILGAKNSDAIIMGSIKNTVDSAMVKSGFYCSGGKVYGKVSTVINGGFFKNIFGYGNASITKTSMVYNGTELTLNGKDNNNQNPFIKYGFKSYAILTYSADNSGNYPSNFAIYGGSNGAEVVSPQDGSRPALKLTVNGGDFPCKAHYECKIYGGSKSGTVSGNIENTITGGNIGSFFNGGNAEGTVQNADITNNISGITLTKAYHGGSESGTMTNVNITNTMKNVTLNTQNFYGSMAGSGTFSGSVTNTFDGGSYEHTVNAACSSTGVSFTGNVTTNIKSNVLFTKALYAGAHGSFTGDVTVNIDTNEYLDFSKIQVGPDPGYTQTGNLTVQNSGDALIKGDITVNGGTVTGKKQMVLNTAYNVAVPETLKASSSYGVQIKSGNGGGILTYDSTDIEADSVDLTEGNITVKAFDAPVENKTYIKMPTGTDKSKIVLDSETYRAQNYPESKNDLKIVDNGTNLCVVGTKALADGIKAEFRVGTDAFWTDIFVQKSAVSSILSSNGSAAYSYEFMGKTSMGSFTSSAEEKDGYYKIDSIAVPLRKFEETLKIKCEGCKEKSVKISDIITDKSEVDKKIGEITDSANKFIADNITGKNIELTEYMQKWNALNEDKKTIVCEQSDKAKTLQIIMNSNESWVPTLKADTDDGNYLQWNYTADVPGDNVGTYRYIGVQISQNGNEDYSTLFHVTKYYENGGHKQFTVKTYAKINDAGSKWARTFIVLQDGTYIYGAWRTVNYSKTIREYPGTYEIKGESIVDFDESVVCF